MMTRRDADMNDLHLARAPVVALLARLGLALLLVLGGSVAAHAQDAMTLKARYADSQERLANNPFGRPMFLESAQSAEDLKGDVYSVIEHPFSTVQQALRGGDHWCDILILHLNVKSCKANGSGAATRLVLAVGKKFDQPPDEAYRLEFAYRVSAATPDYLQVQLNADDGPLGTKNYRIRLEAVPIDAGRSFIHMSYSYGYGFAARMAMQAYLATIGSRKVGFSSDGRTADGKPNFVGGVLGLVERNTMRYYLAIDSYLGAYAAPPAEQAEKRINAWYDATERYATQLHEMDKTEYIEMKRNEIRRQKAAPQ
jgi:hypothetical protein